MLESERRCKEHRKARRTKEVFVYISVGKQHPTNCLPRAPRHRVLQCQTVLRPPSQNRYQKRSSRPGRERWEPTNRGLLPCANGVPENHTGRVLGVRNGCSDGGETGITLVGVPRTGKWEMSGVPGGRRISENAEVRANMGDCVYERATVMLVPGLRAATRDCGVMS